jgi:hypothetical protein
MRKIIYTAVAAAAVLAGSAAAAAPAMASNGPQQAVTHLNNHPDTTGICGVDAIGQDCVWAYDNATEKFTVVNTGPQSWTVTMDYVGSFHGFADPRVPTDNPPGDGLGAALASDGSVKGTITDYVTSPNRPDLSALPGQSAPGTHISDNIRLIFGGDPKVVGGPYSFTYHKVAGADYTQIG